MPEVPAQSGAAGPARWSALDLFRACAVLWMIQGHTFTALAREDALSGIWLRMHGVLHGLTAPMFLVGGGLAYGIVSERRLGRLDDASKPRFDIRMLRRAGELLLVGTLLQVPQTPIETWLELSGLWTRLSSVGPLQLVAGCLILCEGLQVLAGSRARFLLALIGAATALAALSPWIWHARLSERLGPPLGTWFDGHAGSQFPLFPWGVFFLAGVFAARVLPAQRRNEPRFGVRLAAWGAASAGLAVALYLLGARPLLGGELRDFWAASPLYLAFRAALVFAWLGLLIALSPLVLAARRAAPRLAELCDVLARRSLVAYVVHLFWLYGSPLTQGLAQLGRRFSLSEALAIFAGIAVHTIAVTLVWDRFPTQRVRERIALLRGRPSVLRQRADSAGTS